MTRRVRLVVVCRGCGENGSVAGIAMHHARLLAKDFEVLLVSDSLPQALPAGVTGLQVEPASFAWLRRFAHVPSDIAFCRAARRAIAQAHAERPIALLECHAHSVAWLVGRPLQHALGVKVIMVTHGDIRERPPGTYDPRLTAYYRYVTPRAYRAVNRVIALSPPMAELAVTGGALAEHVRLIPNGVDPADIGLNDTDSDSWPEGPGLKLLYVGRLAYEKGVDVLIDAVASATKQGADLSLRIAGSGPELHKLTATVQDHGIASQVAFIGAVPRAQLGALYRSAHVVCVPSRSDPLPTVAIEAMWSGRPVLASDAGGLPFIVQSGGFAVSMALKDGLAKQIVALCSQTSSLQSLGNDARERAMMLFSWESIAFQLSPLFRDLASEPR